VVHKPGILEKFGLYYLKLFRQKDSDLSVFNFTDVQIGRKVNRITAWAIFWIVLISIICVYPTVWLDVKLENENWLTHYGWLLLVTLISIAVELYLLFLISLRTVYKLSEVINVHGINQQFLQDGFFSIKNILARTALEIPDPEITLLGVDPFEQISKRNLLVISLFYKAKIFVTNTIIKYSLIFFIGKEIFGVSILYEALLVECFWNIVVMLRVIAEARLRLFGFALVNAISHNLLQQGLLTKLSKRAQHACLRAIGNAVVFTKNYHPNMVILFFRFKEMLGVTTENEYDNFELLCQDIAALQIPEQNVVKDVFTIAAAFDGKLSDEEEKAVIAIYGNDLHLYKNRLHTLTKNLKEGKLQAALELCKIDVHAG
jgi:hypothetical protein